MAQAAFTHRSDAGAVECLQEKIFHEKVFVCEDAHFQHLAGADVAALARALPHYQRLRRLQLSDFDCSPEEAQAICEAGSAFLHFRLSECAVVSVHTPS